MKIAHKCILEQSSNDGFSSYKFSMETKAISLPDRTTAYSPIRAFKFLISKNESLHGFVQFIAHGDNNNKYTNSDVSCKVY